MGAYTPDDMHGKAESIKTYVGGLDERIEGGIPKGHIVLVCGEAGSMKSSFAMNLLYNYVKETDGKAIYISLEQNKESLTRHMQKLGMDLEALKENLAIIDLGWLRKELKEVTAEEDINWFEALQFQIRKYQEHADYSLMVIDSMEALYVIANMENPRNMLFHFFEGLRDMNLTSFLIAEMEPDKRLFGSHGVESFLADGIVHLNMERTGRSVGRFISVVKMREVKHATDYFPLLVDSNGFKIVTK